LKEISFRTAVTDRQVNLSVSGIHRARFNNDHYAIIREISGVCFKPGEVIQRKGYGFITLPKFTFSLLSILRMMNPEDNFLHANNQPINLWQKNYCFTIFSRFSIFFTITCRIVLFSEFKQSATV